MAYLERIPLRPPCCCDPVVVDTYHVLKIQKDRSKALPCPTFHFPLSKMLAVGTQLCVPAAVAGVQVALEKLQRGVSPRPLDYR